MRLAITACLVALSACGEPPAARIGDAEHGKLLLRQFGCGTCHEIPGVAGARGRVGPPLAGMAARAYIAGVLPNTPQNMAAFIREPAIADPAIVMPAMGVGEEHARDMAAYLSTLR